MKKTAPNPFKKYIENSKKAREDFAEIKPELANLIFKHLFNGVTEDEVLTVVGKSFYYCGRLLSDDEKRGIISEAKMIQASVLWNFLLNEMTVSANEKIFNKAVSPDDILAGKMVLWTLDIMKKKIAKLANWK
jgi:hypothetical protein